MFNAYWILLIVSGIIMIGIGASGFGRATKGVRAINILFGIGFVGYGLYLGLIFTGGTYIIFFKAFIVPVLLIVNAIRGQASGPRRAPTPPAPAAPAASTPWQATTPQPPTIRPATPTLSSDDVLGR